MSLHAGQQSLFDRVPPEIQREVLRYVRDGAGVCKKWDRLTNTRPLFVKSPRAFLSAVKRRQEAKHLIGLEHTVQFNFELPYPYRYAFVANILSNGHTVYDLTWTFCEWHFNLARGLYDDDSTLSDDGDDSNDWYYDDDHDDEHIPDELFRDESQLWLSCSHLDRHLNEWVLPYMLRQLQYKIRSLNLINYDFALMKALRQCGKCQDLKRLIAIEEIGSPNPLNEVFKGCQSLREITFGFPVNGEPAEQQRGLAETWPKLETLKCEISPYCRRSPEFWKYLPISLSNLHVVSQLHLRNKTGNTIYDMEGLHTKVLSLGLEAFTFSDSTLNDVYGMFPGLKSLKLHHCDMQKVTASGFAQFLSQAKLEELELTCGIRDTYLADGLYEKLEMMACKSTCQFNLLQVRFRVDLRASELPFTS